MVRCQGSPSPCESLALAPRGIEAGASVEQEAEDGFGEISSGIPGDRVGLRSGLAQELEESLAGSRLEPWRANPPGEVTDREAAEGR